MSCLKLHLAELSYFGIAPKLFKFIEIAGFGVKNVYHGIEVVHQYPFGIARPFGMRRSGLKLLLYFFVDTIRDGFDVGIGIALTNDEKICGCIAEFPQVKLHDSFTFFVADTLDDEVVELFELRLLCPLFGNADQVCRDNFVFRRCLILDICVFKKHLDKFQYSIVMSNSLEIQVQRYRFLGKSGSSLCFVMVQVDATIHSVSALKQYHLPCQTHSL